MNSEVAYEPNTHSVGHLQSYVSLKTFCFSLVLTHTQLHRLLGLRV